MNLLSLLDQPRQQLRWRVAKVLSEIVEKELGVQLEGRRPAFRLKHDLIVGLFGD
jgi:hypothetical protein